LGHSREVLKLLKEQVGMNNKSREEVVSYLKKVKPKNLWEIYKKIVEKEINQVSIPRIIVFV